MFTVEFPYDIGTFVKVRSDNGDFLYGTIACYQCVGNDNDNDYLIMVSGYKESWCGECLIEDVTPLSSAEIQELKM